MGTPGRLHILCGKVASGKSTLAVHLAQAARTVVISEDSWLSACFSDQMASLEDYVRCSTKLRGAMTGHIADLLRAGLDVVLDFAANTVKQRAWMHEVIAEAHASHILHYLEMDDATCLARLKDRNARGTHPFTVSEAQFHQITAHFVPPDPAEGFETKTHRV